MSKVFFDAGMSLDVYIAGLNGGAKYPLGDGGIAIQTDLNYADKTLINY